jgi:predicted lysophospholipase L1 biosynthesis ABC-type transport system permease subunit
MRETIACDLRDAARTVRRLGLAIGGALSRTLVSFFASSAPNSFLDVSIGPRAFAFAAILAVATCLVFAAIPAWRAARTTLSGIFPAARPATLGDRRSGAVRWRRRSSACQSLS